MEAIATELGMALRTDFQHEFGDKCNRHRFDYHLTGVKGAER